MAAAATHRWYVPLCSSGPAVGMKRGSIKREIDGVSAHHNRRWLVGKTARRQSYSCRHSPLGSADVSSLAQMAQHQTTQHGSRQVT